MVWEALGTDEIAEARMLGQFAEETARNMGSRKSEIVGAFIERQALALLGEERASAYSAQRPLMDMGLDSIELVELKSLINERLGVKLSPMFLFEHERSEEHTSELQSHLNLVCRLLLEKKISPPSQPPTH